MAISHLLSCAAAQAQPVSYAHALVTVPDSSVEPKRLFQAPLPTPVSAYVASLVYTSNDCTGAAISCNIMYPPGCMSYSGYYTAISCTGPYTGVLNAYSGSSCAGNPLVSSPLVLGCNGGVQVICYFPGSSGVPSSQPQASSSAVPGSSQSSIPVASQSSTPGPVLSPLPSPAGAYIAQWTYNNAECAGQPAASTIEYTAGCTNPSPGYSYLVSCSSRSSASYNTYPNNGCTGTASNTIVVPMACSSFGGYSVQLVCYAPGFPASPSSSSLSTGVAVGVGVGAVGLVTLGVGIAVLVRRNRRRHMSDTNYNKARQPYVPDSRAHERVQAWDERKEKPHIVPNPLARAVEMTSMQPQAMLPNPYTIPVEVLQLQGRIHAGGDDAIGMSLHASV
jgi:hypothetical protein